VGRLLVDGMNVIGARPDGWWRDRDRAVRALAAGLARLAAATGDEVTLVLDGRPLDDLAEGDHAGVRVLYARRSGRDAADDRLAELAAADPDPAALVVATSDRALRERVARRPGVRVLGAGELRRRLDELPG
jgi:predicted RNA-binding protein with PIN domain